MKRYKVIDTDCESDVWFDDVENKILDYKDIEKILEKQDIKWQKLKEWLNEKIKEYEPTYDERMALKDDYFDKKYTQALYNKVLERMQELEGEDE